MGFDSDNHKFNWISVLISAAIGAITASVVKYFKDKNAEEKIRGLFNKEYDEIMNEAINETRQNLA